MEFAKLQTEVAIISVNKIKVAEVDTENVANANVTEQSATLANETKVPEVDVDTTEHLIVTKADVAEQNQLLDRKVKVLGMDAMNATNDKQNTEESIKLQVEVEPSRLSFPNSQIRIL